MTRTSVLSIGQNKGTPRIWIEGKYLEANGFVEGMQVKTTWSKGVVTIEPVTEGKGDHTVSRRRNSPLLDYQNAAIREAFDKAEKVSVECSAGKIVITPAKTEAKRAKRQGCDNGTVGSIFSGGGLLDEAAKQAGYETSFAVEFDPDYAGIWQQNHRGHVYQGCISEVPYRNLPQVDLFVGGIPCEPFSAVRRQSGNKRRETTGCSDHALADMSFWALMVIDACNPRTIVLEEVSAYIESEIGQITLKALERMGYKTEWKIIDGTEYGALTTRKRAVIVGVTDGEIRWPEQRKATRTLKDVLLPVDHEECEWFDRTTKSWLYDHWEKQTAKGNGFASQQITEETTSVQAITKRYFAQQGGNPVVAHPTKPGVHRWLTLTEVKRIMGLPDGYFLGESKTTAGEIMGQGVLVDVFRQIIESVAPRTQALRLAA